MRFAIMFAALVLFVGPLAAEDKKTGTREIDQQLIEVLKGVHNQGADLYNSGDVAGSYRLFEGCLRTAKALLPHRPADQKFIDDALAEAAKQSSGQQAFVLHEAIEKLRGRLKTELIVPTDKTKPETLTTPPRTSAEEKKPSPIELGAPTPIPLPEPKPEEKKPPLDPPAPAPKADPKPAQPDLPLAPKADPKPAPPDLPLPKADPKPSQPDLPLTPKKAPPAQTTSSTKREPELLTVLPRSHESPTKPIDKPLPPSEDEQKRELKNSSKLPPIHEGIMGRIYWQGKPVAGAEIAFIYRGDLVYREFNGQSDRFGRYRLERVTPGRYVVVLTMPANQKIVFPERYATAATSPLVVDVKAGGDTLDLLLQ
jgi:hypothetical protein